MSETDLVLVELCHTEVPLLLSHLCPSICWLIHSCCLVWTDDRRLFVLGCDSIQRPNSVNRVKSSWVVAFTSAGHSSADPVAACTNTAVALHLGLCSVLISLILQGTLCTESTHTHTQIHDKTFMTKPQLIDCIATITKTKIFWQLSQTISSIFLKLGRHKFNPDLNLIWSESGRNLVKSDVLSHAASGGSRYPIRCPDGIGLCLGNDVCTEYLLVTMDKTVWWHRANVKCEHPYRGLSIRPFSVRNACVS